MNDRLHGVLTLFRYRWCVPVIAELQLAQGCKFVTLARRLGVADGVLRQTLDYLISIDLVMRNPGYGHPLRPEYILTPAGESLGVKCVILKEAIGGSGLYTRWSGGILLLLDHGPTRQSALKRALVGITPRALSQALKELQEQRLVERIVTPGSPPAVHYQLSDWGERVALFMDGFVVPIRGQLPGP